MTSYLRPSCHSPDWLATSPPTSFPSLPYAQDFAKLCESDQPSTSFNRPDTLKRRFIGTKRQPFPEPVAFEATIHYIPRYSYTSIRRQSCVSTLFSPTQVELTRYLQKCRPRSPPERPSAPPLRTLLPASTPSTCTSEYVVLRICDNTRVVAAAARTDMMRPARTLMRRNEWKANDVTLSYTVSPSRSVPPAPSRRSRTLPSRPWYERTLTYTPPIETTAKPQVAMESWSDHPRTRSYTHTTTATEKIGGGKRVPLRRRERNC